MVAHEVIRKQRQIRNEMVAAEREVARLRDAHVHLDGPSQPVFATVAGRESLEPVRLQDRLTQRSLPVAEDRLQRVVSAR